jgi:CRISPR-associated protein Csd1
MILQALYRYYDILRKDPKVDIAPFGYNTTGISFALNLSEDGELLDVLPMFVQVQRGKKMREVPRTMLVPEQAKRSGSDPKANFLCDNSAFVLGISEKDDEKPEYSAKRFASFRDLHRTILKGVASDASRAVLAFLERHDPATAREHPAIVPHLETLLKGGNIVFMFRGNFVHDDPAVRQTWETYKAKQDAIEMQCLVTGEIAPIARLHPSLKRVRGARAMGTSLVSFNERAYESYGRVKEQGLNSPVSRKATFAYTTALNHLLSDANPNPPIHLGDTTVVYWAESKNRAYEAAFAGIVTPDNLTTDAFAARREAEHALKLIAERIQKGQKLDLDALLSDLGGENPRFYVLGLAPNAARVSVRFFITDPFKKMMQHIMAHYRDLEIVREYEDQPTYLSVWRILNETVSRKSRDKDASPLLAGTVFRSILTNAPYPAALYYAIINRVRADIDDSSKGIHKINYMRAAVIKAYLLRKYRHQPENPFKEVLTMALNEQSTTPAYVLGRLFAVLEKAQTEAIPNINATIKDRYFTSACATPTSVFPILLRMAHHWISKAEYGYVFERRIQELLGLLDATPFPTRFTLDEQGVFILGYYHQRAAFYKKKDDVQETPES